MHPQQEQILDFKCVDKDFWIVNGSQNFAYVKPAKAGAPAAKAALVLPPTDSL